MSKLIEASTRSGHGRYSVDVSRMSVTQGGKYIRLFPAQAIIDDMKANGWERVKAVWDVDDDGTTVAGIWIMNGLGATIAIRYADNEYRKERPYIPVPTKNVGTAVVSAGHASHGMCEAAKCKEDESYFFQMRDGIVFHKE